jgi:4-oxalocrotonate tautomerase
MPYVCIQVTNTNLTTQQKTLLVEGVTKTLVDVLDKDPAKTFVVIQQVGEDNWGSDCKLISEKQ